MRASSAVWIPAYRGNDGQGLGGDVADAELAELAVEGRAADPQPPRDLGHAAAIMADGEADDVGLDLLERAQIAVAA